MGSAARPLIPGPSKPSPVDSVHPRVPSFAVVRYRSLLADSARWDGFEFRAGDIVISTPAKCGTTWVQMLCALLIFDRPDFPAPLDELSPWVDMCNQSIASVRAKLAAQSHRRFIKTHLPVDALVFSPKAKQHERMRATRLQMNPSTQR